MTKDNEAIEIIKKRIKILEQRRKADKRYNNWQAVKEYTAIIRELRYILTKIERAKETDA